MTLNTMTAAVKLLIPCKQDVLLSQKQSWTYGSDPTDFRTSIVVVDENIFVGRSYFYTAGVTTFSLTPPRASLSIDREQKHYLISIVTWVILLLLQVHLFYPIIFRSFKRYHHYFEYQASFLCTVDIVLIHLISCANFADYSIDRLQSLYHAHASVSKGIKQGSYNFHAQKKLDQLFTAWYSEFK